MTQNISYILIFLVISSHSWIVFASDGFSYKSQITLDAGEDIFINKSLFYLNVHVNYFAIFLHCKKVKLLKKIDIYEL